MIEMIKTLPIRGKDVGSSPAGSKFLGYIFVSVIWSLVTLKETLSLEDWFVLRLIDSRKSSVDFETSK